MNPSQVYMCAPPWTLLPPPFPYHPSGSSQCTSPKHPVSCIKPGLATRFIHDILHVSMPFSQIFPPSPSPTESIRLFYINICHYASLYKSPAWYIKLFLPTNFSVFINYFINVPFISFYVHVKHLQCCKVIFQRQVTFREIQFPSLFLPITFLPSPIGNHIYIHNLVFQMYSLIIFLYIIMNSGDHL